MSTYFLIYTSKAASRMPVAELLALLKQSRSDNSLRQVSGMLLYVEGRFLVDLEGRFIQLLEGSRQDVRALYATIQRDNRHKGLILLAEGEAENRYFKDWTMGFRLLSLEDMQQVPGYFELNDSFLTNIIDREIHSPLSYLRSFYDVSWQHDWQPAGIQSITEPAKFV